MTESKVVVPMGAWVAANHGYACTNSLKGTKDASDSDRLMCAVEEVFGWLDGELPKRKPGVGSVDWNMGFDSAIDDVRRMFRAPEPILELPDDVLRKHAEEIERAEREGFKRGCEAGYAQAKRESDAVSAPERKDEAVSKVWQILKRPIEAGQTTELAREIVAAVREADAKAAMEQCNNAVNAMMGIPQKPQHLWTTGERNAVAEQQVSRQGANGIIDPQKCPHRWAVKTDYSTMDKVVYCELCEWEYSRTAMIVGDK